MQNPKASMPFRHPIAFLWEAVKQFRATQGLLLAGAVAYYALLSIVPLLIVSVIALSRFVDQEALLGTIGRYLEWLLPGQSRAIVAELANFLLHRDVLGPVLLVTMIFFSSLAFTVLESAMAVIFHHRKSDRTRHFVVSAVMPYLYIFSLGFGLLLVTLVSGVLQIIGTRIVRRLRPQLVAVGRVGRAAVPARARRRDLHADVAVHGDAGRAPVAAARAARRRRGRAAVGITRRALVWYFATLSQVNVVYGSLTTAIVVLLSLEIAATLVLFGAQVIAQYERLDRTGRLRAVGPPTL